jgi:error-prone DNA polymerase
MICAADTVGVFQIESRAQMSMLPRLRPRCFYDLVIEVAIVRPGPIQGGMIHPYLRRRDGREPITYPSAEVRQVLQKTLGVPIFQEQVMRLAVVAAGFTPGEADQLRRAMAAWRRSGEMEKFQLRLIKGMLAKGYSKEFARQIYLQIRGFGEYGFPESHAASFALLVYASAWLKRYHPAAFYAAMLNSQPLGFYTPGQLIRDAIAHGVRVLPVDVNYSKWDCTLEQQGTGNGERGAGWHGYVSRECVAARARARPGVAAGASAGCRAQCAAGVATKSDSATWGQAGPCLRLGMRLIRGLSAEKVAGISAARAAGNAVADALAGRTPTGAPPFQGWGTDSNSECSREPNRAPAFEEVGHPSERPDRAIPLIPRSLEPSIPITSIRRLARRGDVSRETLVRLAAADAFRSLGLGRRQALWHILALDDAEPPLFAELEPNEPATALPEMSPDETVVHDYDALGFSLNAHPIGLVRHELDGMKRSHAATQPRSHEGVGQSSALGRHTGTQLRSHEGVGQSSALRRHEATQPQSHGGNVAARAPARPLRISRAEQLEHMRNGQPVAVAGLVTVRQRPGTAKGITFVTLEDETGVANLVIRPKIWKRDRRVARSKIALIAEGHVERQGAVIHVVVRRLHDLSERLAGLRHRSRDFH